MRKIVATLLVIGLLSVTAHGAISAAWVNVTGANTPVGYTSWDLMVTVGTNIAVQEMILATGVAGDIYQDGFGSNLEPNPAFYGPFPAIRYDTYVTTAWSQEHAGVWAFPTPTTVIGGAVDITPGSVLTFTNKDLNVAWGPTGGSNSGAGTWHEARVTLKNTAQGSVIWKGWQSGGDQPVMMEKPIVNGIIIPEPATMLVLLGGLVAGLIRRS